MKKINPRRRPASMADVKHAKQQATNAAINDILLMVLYVLKDKHGASDDDLEQLAAEINYVADSIARGYLTIADVRQTLGQEYGVTLNLHD